jgi:molecular chaperone GrpE
MMKDSRQDPAVEGPDTAMDETSEAANAAAPMELELTDDELQALCRDRLCPACPVGAQAEDDRLRALAELDNTRKRLEREKEEYRKYASEKVLADLLPALDNLDLALNHAPQDAASKNFVLGVDMTRKALLDALAGNGLVPVGEAGVEFTPELHEAVGQDQRDDLPPGVVTRVLQRGYKLNGRLLRPAKVMVSAGQ